MFQIDWSHLVYLKKNHGNRQLVLTIRFIKHCVYSGSFKCLVSWWRLVSRNMSKCLYLDWIHHIWLRPPVPLLRNEDRSTDLKLKVNSPSCIILKGNVLPWWQTVFPARQWSNCLQSFTTHTRVFKCGDHSPPFLSILLSLFSLICDIHTCNPVLHAAP